MSACAGVTRRRNSASIAASGSKRPGLFPSDSIDSMSDGPVSYRLDDSIAFITMDDGKVNVLGPTMQQALNDALDHADRDDAGAVVIAGNDRVFSGGFALKILTSREIQPAHQMPQR